jgi:hypothetical protein
LTEIAINCKFDVMISVGTNEITSHLYAYIGGIDVIVSMSSSQKEEIKGGNS